MAFVAAQQSRLYLGNLHLSGYTKGFTTQYATQVLDATTLVDTAMKMQPGLKSATVSLDLLLDTDTTSNGESDVLASWFTTQPMAITLAPFGTTVSSAAELVSGLKTNYTIDSTPTELVKASVAATGDTQPDIGIILDPSTGVTADGSSTSVDSGAASANGGVAHLHVTAFSGLTSDAIIVEHSTNNSVWATLGTFTTVTGVTNQRLVIAAGTTVNRYLRVTDDVTGTGTCTRIVAFARR